MIPKSVTKAVSLLRETGYTIKDPLSLFDLDSCPIAEAYGLKGVNVDNWDKSLNLPLEDRGWTRRMFRVFLEWHDTMVKGQDGGRYFPNREKLAKLLEAGKNVNHSRKGKQVRSSSKRKVA